MLFASNLFGAEEVAFKELDRALGEGADGTFLGEEPWEELIDERMNGIAGFGLQLNNSVSSTGEFAEWIDVAEEFFVAAERVGLLVGCLCGDRGVVGRGM